MDDFHGSARVVRFGVFEADLQTGELHKNGVRVPLQGQPFQVCAILLSHSGELVSREELRQRVWPQDTFVDFDQALNTAIAKIRTALGDDAENPKFVETLPRRGYRFVGAVDKPCPQAPPASVSRWHSAEAKVRWTLGGVGAVLLIMLSGIGVIRLSRNRREVPLPPTEIVPMLGLSGLESEVALSPDGNHVVFALRGSKNPGIYAASVGGEKSLRLTSDFHDCCPR